MGRVKKELIDRQEAGREQLYHEQEHHALFNKKKSQGFTRRLKKYAKKHLSWNNDKIAQNFIDEVFVKRK